MGLAEVEQYMSKMKRARADGKTSDEVAHDEVSNIHSMVDTALRRAMKSAKGGLNQRLQDEISTAEREARMSKAAATKGNLPTMEQMYK